MKKDERYCKYCNEPINLSVGRRDRLFCSEICKNKYHNEKQYTENKEMERVTNILKKNRGILKKLFEGKNNDEVSKDKMLKAGFEFDYHTHFKKTYHYDREYTFCHDYGYRLVKDRYKIVKAFGNKEE